MINLTWEKAMLTKNLKDELQRHPELRPLNTKLNNHYAKSRKKLKALAEKHDIKQFINESQGIVWHFQQVCEEAPTFIDYSVSSISKKAENLLTELKQYSSECWFYCQGDKRIQI